MEADIVNVQQQLAESEQSWSALNSGKCTCIICTAIQCVCVELCTVRWSLQCAVPLVLRVMDP